MFVKVVFLCLPFFDPVVFRNLSHVGHLPSSSAFSSMKDDLAFKEGEVEKSKNTLEGLDREHQQLTLNLGELDE